MLPVRAGETGLRRYAVLPVVFAVLIGGAAGAKMARIGFVEFGQAGKLAEKARYDEALPLLQSAVRHEPDLPQFHFELGFVCMKLHRNKEAIAAFRKVLESEPDVAAAHYNLGVLYREDGRLEEAILELQRASALDPKDPESRYQLGLIFLQKKDSVQAIRWLQNALALKPDYAEAKEALAAAEHPSDRVSR